jgi:hypothetical protein
MLQCHSTIAAWQHKTARNLRKKNGNSGQRAMPGRSPLADVHNS